MKSSLIKDKLVSTVKNKYNVENISQLPTIKEQKIRTIQQNYGVDYYFQSDKHKMFIESDDFKVQCNLHDTIEKRKKNCLLKYGVSNFKQSHISADNLSKLNDREWLIKKHHFEKKNLTELGNLLGVNRTTISLYLKKFNIEIKKYWQSKDEKELSKFLSNYETVIERERSLIHPYEVDIYIPKKKLAIEYCGLYWHTLEAGKDKNYHKMKYELCKQKGIRLLTIFEDEWLYRKELVKKKILYILGCCEDKKIYARNTIIKEIDEKCKKTFFNNTHIQGDGPSSINYGLFYNDELVSVIGFIRNKDYYILNRYSTSCQVIGGFSKLLKYFENKYNKPKIITFADLRWSDGELYSLNGFTFDKILIPDYSYTKRGKRFHKFNFRHRKLKKLLSNYDENKTEYENMLNDGYERIYDCGKLRYVKN